MTPENVGNHAGKSRIIGKNLYRQKYHQTAQDIEQHLRLCDLGAALHPAADTAHDTP